MTKSEKKIKTMADLCELAHKRTVRECKKKNIGLNCLHKFLDGECPEHDADEEHYSNKAQAVFDRHYHYLEEITGI